MKIFSKLEIFIIVKSEFSFTLVISQLVFIKSIILPIPKDWVFGSIGIIQQNKLPVIDKSFPVSKCDTLCSP